MINYPQLELDELANAIAKKLNLYKMPAILGDQPPGSATAAQLYDPTIPGNVWVLEVTSNGYSTRTSVRGPTSSTVAMRAGMPVLLKYDIDGKLAIDKIDFTAVQAAGGNPLQNNASDAQANAFVSTSSITTLLCTPTAPPSTNVALFGWKPVISDVLIDFPGALVDLSSFIPIAGEHCVAVIFIQSDYLTVEVFASTAKSTSDPITIADVQEAIDQKTADSMELWVWRLHDNQASINDGDRFLDLRQIWNICGSCGGGGAPATATYITQTADAGLSAEQALSSLATGYMKVTTTTGVVSSQAVPIPVADGGSGATSLVAHAALIGNGTSAIATLAPGTSRNAMLSDGTDWASRALVAADLPNTAVTPASYTNTNLTVDAQGRITAASNGTDGTGQNQATCNGRLTLTSGTPVTTADVTAATTLYFALYKGNQIALYNGSTWDLITFTEPSIAIPSTTSTMYDVFGYNNSGALALELTAWTNVTTRATALTTQDGVLCKTGALTRRFLGIMETTTVSGQTEVSIKRVFVKNYYNRLRRYLKAVESTASWAYTTTSFRAANNATVVGTSRVEFIIDWLEDPIKAAVYGIANTLTGVPAVGVGLDSTTANSALITNVQQNINNEVLFALYEGYPAVGYHYLQWLEYGAASGTFYGTGITNAQTGLLAEIWA